MIGDLKNDILITDFKGCSRYQRLLLFLNKIPIINKFVINKIKKTFKLPLSTSLSMGFYISAPLLQIEENVSLGETYIVAYAPILIGKGTTLSYKNTIITSTHDFNNWGQVIGKPVRIGRNCWITTNVTILPGVTIGNNVVIGAGSVVSRDVPDNVFAAGNPCKVIKEISFRKNE